MKSLSDWKLALDLSFQEYLDDLAARNDHRRVTYIEKYVEYYRPSPRTTWRY